MMQPQWQGKIILITGAGGFVGSHLLHFFSCEGARVIGITRSSKKNQSQLQQADVASKRQLEPYFAAHSAIDVCFHLAGDALVEEGQDGPYETFRNNLMSTLNILELSRQYKVRKLVVASTVHVYGHAATGAKEQDPPLPSRPYETSKTCTDLLAQSYADTYGLPVLIPRFSNIYGPGDLNFSRLIPKTIRSVLRDEKPAMWGGTATRDYLYIDDAIDAYTKLASLPNDIGGKNKIFNFGTGNHKTVREIIETIIRLCDKRVSINGIENQREHEVLSQFVLWEKASKILHWKPKVNLEEGLKKTIAWYKEHLHRFS